MIIEKFIRNTIYTTNIEDIELCLKILLNKILLCRLPDIYFHNNKIKINNELEKKLAINNINMDIKNIDYENSLLITFYKNRKKLINSKVERYILYNERG